MYSLIIFYVLSSQFHTDVSSITIPFYSEKLCMENKEKIISLFKKVHEPSNITSECIKTGEKNGAS